jgi:hypothetical protein
MPSMAPAILPSHPKRPKVRNAAVTSPARLSPDTFPFPKFLKKLPNISSPLPPKIPRKKLLIPLHLLLMSPMAPFTASTASPALFFSPFTSSTASDIFSVVSFPTTTSLAISTMLLSLTRFCHATYPAALPTAAVFIALPAPFSAWVGCTAVLLADFSPCLATLPAPFKALPPYFAIFAHILILVSFCCYLIFPFRFHLFMQSFTMVFLSALS